MDSLDCDISFETEEGNQYVLRFKMFSECPVHIKKPVITVSLVLLKEKINHNSLKFFHYITKEIVDYLSKNDVILYYYCDVKDIDFRKSRSTTPQEYRSRLFTALFDHSKNNQIYQKNFILKDPIYGDHYISLLYKEDSNIEVDLLAEAICGLQKDNSIS